MRERRTPVCALVSGGLDSAIMLQRLVVSGWDIVPLYCRFGLRWETAELFWLKRLLRTLISPSLQALHVVELPLQSLYGAHWSLSGRRVPAAKSPDRAVYLPGRNVFLLSAASIVCAQRRLPAIAVGVLRSNPFGDAAPSFLARFADCLSQAVGQPIRVLTPLRGRTKSQWLRWAAPELLRVTFSCLQPRRRHHCGRCNKCAERQRAFQTARLLDPTVYAG